MHLPPAFLDTSLTALPAAEHAAFLAALATPPVRGLRLRPGVPLATLRAALPGPYAPIPWAQDAYALDAASPAGTHPLHAAGAYYLQEPSAMAAAPQLDIHPGQRVLDLCAAPGGKSTQLAALLGRTGILVANEIVPSRARILSQNIERMGVPNAIVTCEAPDRLAARWPGFFDRILVDAPCSGEGMFRRHPETAAQWTPQSPAGCAARQLTILESAARMLRPGGRLVYSTCTFNETENEHVVAAFLQTHPDFAPAAPAVRLWPHRDAGEGHFVAALRKAGADPAEANPTPPPDPTRLCDLFPPFGSAAAPGIPHTAGDHLWLAPPDAPPLDGIRVLRHGLALGTWRGRIFVPDHAAAMAFPPDAFAQSVDTDADGAARYLRGETLPAPDGLPAGWTVIRHLGLSLGWAKHADGILKNHLPKGLRQMARERNDR